MPCFVKVERNCTDSERFKNEIWEHITEESEASGYTNPFAYLAEYQFANFIEDTVTMENGLVRYMAESMAYRLTENK